METHSQLCLVLVITLYFSSLAQSGTHLDKPWFRWSGGKVPFFFQVLHSVLTTYCYYISLLWSNSSHPKHKVPTLHGMFVAGSVANLITDLSKSADSWLTCSCIGQLYSMFSETPFNVYYALGERE